MFFFQKMRKHTLEEKPAKIDNCIEEKDKRRSTIKAILKRRLILRKVNTKKERRFCKVLVTEEGKLVEFRNVEFL